MLTIKYALRNAGWTSDDDTSKADNTPKINYDISKKTKPRISEAKTKKTKHDPGLKKAKKTKYRKRRKNKSLPNEPTRTAPLLDEATIFANIRKLGFSEPEDILNYWRKIKEYANKKSPHKIVAKLNLLNIQSPKGENWNAPDFKEYQDTKDSIVLYIEKNGSLDGLGGIRWSSSKTTQNEAAAEHVQANKSSQSPLKTLDTDTLFKKYRAALVSLSKGNQKLSEPANKTIKNINNEFLRRFDGTVNKEGYFIWPNTKIYASHLGLSDQKFWQEKGVLTLYGYRVGKTHGEPQNVRRQILDEVFKANIPPILERFYIREWDAPNSALRLKKMANTLAELTKNARRKTTNMDTAIEHWEEDLRYLYNKYYVGKFGFGWPDT